MERTVATWTLDVPHHQTRNHRSAQPHDTEEPRAGRYHECRQDGRSEAAPGGDQGTPSPSENSLRAGTELVLSNESDGCAHQLQALCLARTILRSNLVLTG
jgi:hypothetical protein